MKFQLVESFSCSADRVFKGLTQVEAFNEWMPNLVRIEVLTEGAFGIGTRWRETRKMFGKEGGELFEVTACDAEARTLTLFVDGTQGSTGKGAYNFRYRIEEREGGGAEMTMDAEISGMGLMGKLMGWMLVGMFKKMIQKDHTAFRSG